MEIEGGTSLQQTPEFDVKMRVRRRPDWLRRVMDFNAHCVFLDTSTIGLDARETPPPTINEPRWTSPWPSSWRRGSATAEHGGALPFNAQVDALQID